MVSEDSQDFGRLPVVHRLGDLSNFPNARDRQMLSLLHELDDPNELLEVISLGGSKWIRLEEGNDLGEEIIESVDVVTQQVFLVVIASTVPVDLSASEELNHFL
jgi:hypothetical protein